MGPAYLSELPPAAARGTFAGTVYQTGNLIAAVNNPLQSAIAEHTGGNYSLALEIVATCAALLPPAHLGETRSAQ